MAARNSPNTRVSPPPGPPPRYRSFQGSNSSGSEDDTTKGSFSNDMKSTPSNTYSDAQMATLAQSLSLVENEQGELPTVDQAIAHLELLEAFYALKSDVSEDDGLFDLWDQDVQNIPRDTQVDGSSPSLLAEKRWAVYVTMAVERFSVWWECLRKRVDAQMLDLTANASTQNYPGVADEMAKKMVTSRDDLPPLDILMVWHAFKLNPRCYLEDCLRQNMMCMWYNPMPWAAIHESIDPNNGNYNPGPASTSAFESLTGLKWSALKDAPYKAVPCPLGHGIINHPWTTCGQHLQAMAGGASEIPSGTGYADRDFVTTCPTCALTINHDMLRACKFASDATIAANTPMGGTILGSKGLFNMDKPVLRENIEDFPNRVVRALFDQLNLDNSRALTYASMTEVRDDIQTALADTNLIRKAIGSKVKLRALFTDKVAVRRMMSRYWENSSPFALDLVGAVIRQADFVEKMHNIDWLHSPAISATMTRLLTKYTRFFNMLRAAPGTLIVPTLDVDLAWHTHQLSPYPYYAYAVRTTKSFTDHDDKIADTKLSSAFAKTSELYQKLYKEPYSLCTCWYCEATRASHTSTASRLFNRSTVSETERQLYDPNANIPSDPNRCAHISAHNAIHPVLPASLARLAPTTTDLRSNLEKADKRARKAGRPLPSTTVSPGSSSLGLPFLPAYLMVGVGMGAGAMYASNPGCASFVPGSAGNCAQGSCGGGVAAGACAGGAMGGGCAGGIAGGCAGAGGSGGCGGGGGGGCGGGGGGCGGGGGGCGGG